MKILVVGPGKHPYTQEIKGDLASMQAVVGGLIQAVYPFEEQVALICNEEGKLLGLPPNRVLRDDKGRIYDVICGTFFLCTCPAGSDSFEGLNAEQLERYTQHFYLIEFFIG